MEKDIGKINKNETSDILLRIDDFGGRVGLTIREFVTSDRYTGFTKAGVRILSQDFLKFREMINSIDLEDMKNIDRSEEKSSLDQETLNRFKTERPGEDLPDYWNHLHQNL